MPNAFDTAPGSAAPFASPFVEIVPAFRASSRPQHALFDLPGYIAARLAAAGIRGIEDLGHCTYADATRFFSYRRSTHRKERDYGRHINAIALVG